ncbi:hypothetical protein D3C87_1444180 [compost metagenome]
MGFLVLGWHPAKIGRGVVVVYDVPRERQRARAPFLSHLAEHPGWAHIVGGRGKVDDKGPREKVGALFGCCALVMNEDVGKWSCGVADIGLAGKGVQHLPDQAVNGLRLMLFIWRPVVVEHLFARVDRCMVCLVVDHQKRQLGYELAAVD